MYEQHGDDWVNLDTFSHAEIPQENNQWILHSEYLELKFSNCPQACKNWIPSEGLLLNPKSFETARLNGNTWEIIYATTALRAPNWDTGIRFPQYGGQTLYVNPQKIINLSNDGDGTIISTPNSDVAVPMDINSVLARIYSPVREEVSQLIQQADETQLMACETLLTGRLSDRLNAEILQQELENSWKLSAEIQEDFRKGLHLLATLIPQIFNVPFDPRLAGLRQIHAKGWTAAYKVEGYTVIPNHFHRGNGPLEVLIWEVYEKRSNYQPIQQASDLTRLPHYGLRPPEDKFVKWMPSHLN